MEYSKYDQIEDLTKLDQQELVEIAESLICQVRLLLDTNKELSEKLSLALSSNSLRL